MTRSDLAKFTVPKYRIFLIHPMQYKILTRAESTWLCLLSWGTAYKIFIGNECPLQSLWDKAATQVSKQYKKNYMVSGIPTPTRSTQSTKNSDRP